MKSSAAAFVPPALDFAGPKPQISEKHFKVMTDLMLAESGIYLNHTKLSMLESRLVKRLRESNCENFDEYIQQLKTNPKERQEFIEALTTNKTEFFRECDHFDYLKNTVLPEFVAKHAGSSSGKSPSFRMWSAASSTGEEAYTTAMVLTEFFHLQSPCDFKIVGTDINSKVIEKAKQAVYPAELIKAVRPDWVQKYFQRAATQPAQYRVSSDLRSLIKFRIFNLIKDEFNVDIKFDVIFLRNVLIYFQPDVIELIINKMARYLKPGGYLFIGHSETLSRIKHPLTDLHSAVFKKV